MQAELHPIQKPIGAFQVVNMDITAKLGTQNDRQYLVVIINAFTKYVLFYYANDKSQHSKLAALKRIVHLFGTAVQVDGVVNLKRTVSIMEQIFMPLHQESAELMVKLTASWGYW